ncbi:MAG TPA: YndJ family transporter [Candidatus Sulfotelmatobacter sp.]|nr:YndJ family transporter [Candidatus Sulfotelmatobacter sp.]
MRIQEEREEQRPARSLRRGSGGSSFARNYRSDAFTESRTKRWAEGWATAGAALWAGIAVLARMGIARIGVIELMFLFAPLVIVPLGMELARLGGFESGVARACAALAQTLQPLGAVLAVVAVCLPPGGRAGFVAAGWMVVCGLMASGGAVELGHLILRSTASMENLTGGVPVATRAVVVSEKLPRIAGCVAVIDLAVGGAWLVASRLGWRPMGIQEPIGLLTAVHFHFAGFATALIAGATLRFAEASLGGRGILLRWLRRVVVFVIVMPFVVAAGFVISPALKMVAAMAFSASVAALAGFVWMCAGRVEDGTARGLLRLAAGAVLVGMAFSGTYAVADFVKSDLMPIPRMASTHGVLNAVGFCLLGLLGWIVEGSARTFTTLPASGQAPGTGERGGFGRRETPIE